MKEDVKVSVILAVYNGDNIIRKTLDTIRRQIFKDFEVVIVNDGSTDRTCEIVESYCKLDNRFKLFNKPNGGVASARNLGISKATGEYIIHHDDDDFMPDNALLNLYNKAVETNADIVIADYNVVRGSKVTKVSIKPTESDYMYYINELLEGKLHGSLWNKLIKKSLYGDTTFEDGIDYMEDKLLLLRLLYKKPEVVYLPEVVYNYVQNENSLTGGFSKKSFDSLYSMIKCLENDLEKNNIVFDLTNIKLNYKLRGILYQHNYKIRNVFPESNKRVLKSKRLSIKHKMLLLASIVRFNFLLKLMFNIKNLKNNHNIKKQL